jgi:DNA gyrase subunit B
MPALIEKGYIYIAQPPLFRIKKGKKGRYVKNEAAMREHLMELAADEMSLYLDRDKTTVHGGRFKAILKKLIAYESIIEHLSRKDIDPDFLRVLTQADFIDRECLKNRDTLEAFMLKVSNDWHRPDSSDTLVYTIEVDEAHASFRVQCQIQKNGLSQRFCLDQSLVTAPEFKDLKPISPYKLGLGLPPYRMSDGEGEKHFENAYAIVQHVLERGKKGLSIQRYKGLGEMNPSQLWETTMDPEKRTLLQVTLENVYETDEIFSVLMGDAVEPRRNFIQKHAAEVKNLDV